MSYILIVSVSVAITMPGAGMSSTSYYPYPFSDQTACVVAGVAVKDANPQRNVECVTKQQWDDKFKTNISATPGELHMVVRNAPTITLSEPTPAKPSPCEPMKFMTGPERAKLFSQSERGAAIAECSKWLETEYGLKLSK